MKLNQLPCKLFTYWLLIPILAMPGCAPKNPTVSPATVQVRTETATSVLLSPVPSPPYIPVSPLPSSESQIPSPVGRAEPEHMTSNDLEAEYFELPLYTLFFWTGMVSDSNDYIWIANNQLRIIADFNIERGLGERVISLSQDLKQPPWVTGLAWDGSKFWVSDVANEMIYQIDPITGKRLEGFTYNDTPTGLAWVDDSLWIISIDNLAIEKVTSEGERLLSLAIEAKWPTGLAWDGRYFWYSDGYDGTISIVNPASGKSERLDELKFMTTANTFNGLTWLRNYLWVVNEQDDRLFRFDVSQLDWQALNTRLQ